MLPENYVLLAEGVALAVVLGRYLFGGKPETPAREVSGGPSPILPALVGALQALKAKGYRGGCPALVQLSALIEKAREGDPRATPDLARFVLGKFPYEIVGAYMERL